ncbi:hypothetical protein [Bisbaumannia pacifica]|nr:hypothetical protein [Halomonas pacifica]
MTSIQPSALAPNTRLPRSREPMTSIQPSALAPDTRLPRSREAR